MEANVDLWLDDSHATDNLGRYKRLIEKLIFAMPDITFAVGVLNRFMHQLRETHWLAVIRILSYINNCPRK